MTIQYPFHPATGQRLVRVIEAAIFLSATRIVMADGDTVIDDIPNPSITPASHERAQIDGIPFVATITGHTCLLSEAIWSPLDVDQIERITGEAIGTALPTLNSVMCDLVHLGEAASAVVENWETRNLATSVADLEESLQTSTMLSSYLSGEPEGS